MHRLLHGDVGSKKIVVSALAEAQVTELLDEQHSGHCKTGHCKTGLNRWVFVLRG
ncbi:hypothetical protein [Candidatus Vallotia cooleyia]|uniref:hypothetical protein n=1 Tax=Candidatus Vallotiella adelgis TaxID=1177211 RepID=UPI001D0044DD|nr:hypothetical protein [Candidatus Vallotia cooleyia]